MKKTIEIILILSTFLLLGSSSIYADNPVTIAIIDSGIDKNRLNLQTAITKTGNLINQNQYPNDETGHGTMVSSIIHNNNPKFKIIPIKIDSKFKKTTMQMFSNAILLAIENEADVINISMGAKEPSSLLEKAVEKSVEMGIPIVAASGNDSNNRLRYPAAYPNVISVGAVNSDGIRIEKSNYGSQLDFVGPGNNIKVRGRNGRINNVSGTSIAAPVVSLKVAEIINDNPDISLEGINKKLLDISQDVGKIGWDKFTGYGLIQY